MKNIADKILNVFGYKKAMDASDFNKVASMITMGSDSAVDGLEAYSGGFVSWVNTCANRTARDISNKKLYFANEKGERLDWDKVDERIRLPFENGHIGAATMKQLRANQSIFQDLAGNGLWWKTYASLYGEKRNITEQFVQIKPGDFKRNLSSSGLIIVNYEIRLKDGRRMLVDPDQVIDFKSRNVINPFEGASLVSSMLIDVQGYKEASNYFTDYIRSKGTPDLVMIDKQNRTYEQIVEHAQLYEKAFASKKYRDKLMYIAGKDIEIQSMASNMRDVELGSTRDFMRSLIISHMESTPSVLGLVLPGLNKAIADKYTSNYFEVINSKNMDYVDIINNGHVYKIDPSRKVNLMVEKYATGDITEIEKAVKTGLMTPAEGSEKIGVGYDKNDPAQNQRYFPAGFNRLEDVGLGLSIDIPTGDIKKKTINDPFFDSIKFEEDKYQDYDHKTWQSLDSKCIDDYKHDIETYYVNGEKRKRNDVGATPEQMKYLKQADKSKAGTIKKYKGKLNNFLDEQAGRVLQKWNDLIVPNGEYSASSIDIVFSDYIEREALKATTEPLHTSAIQKAVGDNNSIIGSAVSPALNNPEIAQALSTLTQIGERVNVSTRRALTQIINQGIKEGLSVHDIADKLEKLPDLYKSRNRALTIARTETLLGYREGSKLSFNDVDTKLFDVIGCIGTISPGMGIRGMSASYGSQDETVGNCGLLGVDMRYWDEIDHHPNHGGVEVPRI